jgi:hypothetical protein
MNYFKNNSGDVFAYDDEQVAAGLPGDMTPMTPEEVETHLNPVSPAPLPFDPSTELANPTVAEWNALCEAAGATELMK